MQKKCFVKISNWLVLLILVYFYSCKTNGGETATNRILLKSDTSAIDGWELLPGNDENLEHYKILRKNGKWMISVNGAEPAETDTAYLRRSLQHISALKAQTKLQIPENKWDTAGLTNKGARLIVYKNGRVENEIILGKMFFSKESKTGYYVRLKDEKEIYTVLQYLEGSVKVPAQKLRKNVLVGISPQQIAEVMFLKPEGIDFAMKRAGEHSWSINSMLTNDSLSDNYVGALSKLQIANFGESPSMGADLSIQITTYNKKQISIRAYKKNNETWILSSSENQGNYVELPQDFIFKLFPGREYFMQQSAK